MGIFKDIFSQNTINSEDNSEETEKDENDESEDKKELIEDNKNDIIDKNKNEEKKSVGNKFISDFEVVDDIFFMDDIKKSQKDEKKANNKNLEKNSKNFGASPKENKKSQENKKKDDFEDDFTIIETKTSLERKYLRQQKEEEGKKYSLELNSLHVYLFAGFDFYFEDDKNNDLDLSDAKNKKNKKNDENEPLEINKNYLFKYNHQKKKKNRKILQVNRRKKIEEREYNNYILLNIINLSISIIDFCYYDLCIDNLFIDDNLEKSQFSKVISKQDYSNNLKFLICKLEINKNAINKNEQCVFLNIFLTLPSLDILIDQLFLEFIIIFIIAKEHERNDNNENDEEEEKKEEQEPNKPNDNSHSNEKDNKGNEDNKDNKDINNDKNDIVAKDDNNKEKSKDSLNDADVKKEENEDRDKVKNKSKIKVYINEISINPFGINFHYNSHKIEFRDLINDEDLFQILNMLIDIKDFNIKFKNYRKNAQTEFNQAMSDLKNFWIEDIKQNQLVNSILGSLSITRPFYKLYNGVRDLIIQPYLSYTQNEGIKEGFKKGMKNFFVSVSSQGLFFGEKIFRGYKFITFQKTKLSLKKESLYKAWVHKINEKQYEYEKHYFK